jgi:hypothetical protein
MSTSSEIGGGISGTFRVVAKASLNAAYKKSKQEDTPVALQIVKDCMEIAKTSSSASDREQRIATNYQHRAERILQQWQQQQVEQTPTIALSSHSARIGEQVTVTGSNFWPNEMVDIVLHATIVAQVNADNKGAFSTVITVPSSAPPPDFDTVISATGQTSSRTAKAPFHTAP